MTAWRCDQLVTRIWDYLPFTFNEKLLNILKKWCVNLLYSFYVLSARLSHHNSVRLSVCLSVCLSVRLSVRLSHRWISQKRCKLELPNLHRQLPGRL